MLRSICTRNSARYDFRLVGDYRGNTQHSTSCFVERRQSIKLHLRLMLQSADAFNPPPLQLQCHTAFHCSTQHAQRTLASFAMAAPPSRASHHSRVPGLRSEDAAYRVTGPDARRLLRSSASAILSPTRPRTGASHASLARPTTGRSVSSRSSFTSRKSGQTVSHVVVR